MPKYAYVAVAPDGQEAKGVERADSRAAAEPVPYVKAVGTFGGRSKPQQHLRLKVVEQAPVAFGCLLLALGLRAAARLFGALGSYLDAVLPLAAVALGHDHPSVPTGTG